MVEYGFNKNLIRKRNIKHVIYSSLTIPKDYFNGFIDHLYATMGEHSKLAVNSIVGCFKPKNREHWQTLCIVDNPNEAYSYYLRDQGCHISPIMTGGSKYLNQVYYHVYGTSYSLNDDTEAPLYNMILDMAAIELHELTEVIKEKKGEVLDLSTDAVTCCFPNSTEFPFELMEDGIHLKGYTFDGESPK